MVELIVSTPFNNKRIDTFLFETLTNIPSSVIFRAFRKKDVRVNNKRVPPTYLVASGDRVQLYITLDNSEKSTMSLDSRKEVPSTSSQESSGEPQVSEPVSVSHASSPRFPAPSIIYEDQNIVAVSKPQGIPVQTDKNNDNIVLDIWVRDYFRKRDNTSYDDGFPALCHRLDRNTGGLVLFAKNRATLNILEDKFRSHEIKRIYHCIVDGIPKKASAELRSYLKKDSKRSLVSIFDKPVKHSDSIVTRYRVLKSTNSISLLKVELITGKTHQRRAHLAHIGYPVLGDGKYGINSVNRAYKLKWHALWSKEITFMFTTDSGHLDYLNQKSIMLPEIHWEKQLI